MKSRRIFSRQLLGMDSRVIHVILAVIIISIGLLSYRLIDANKCTPVNFIIKTITTHTDSTYIAGETLSFIAAVNTNEITWDFGDNSEKVTGQYVTHKYEKTGSFNVTASTGIACETVQGIIILPAGAQDQKDARIVTGEEIIGPVSTIVGTPVSFTCMVTAGSYEWSIPNYPKMVRSGSTAKFEFPSAGKFLVQVTLDHDRTKRFSREITVEAAPIEKSKMPENIKPLIPDGVQPLPSQSNTVKISDAVFKEYLEKVIEKKMSAEDFDSYLCYKGETKVVLNGDVITFKELCEEISGKKRRKFIIGKTAIKIKAANMRRDADGCVNIIEVKYN